MSSGTGGSPQPPFWSHHMKRIFHLQMLYWNENVFEVSTVVLQFIDEKRKKEEKSWFIFTGRQLLTILCSPQGLWSWGKLKNGTQYTGIHYLLEKKNTETWLRCSALCSKVKSWKTLISSWLLGFVHTHLVSKKDCARVKIRVILSVMATIRRLYWCQTGAGVSRSLPQQGSLYLSGCIYFNKESLSLSANTRKWVVFEFWRGRTC